MNNLTSYSFFKLIKKLEKDYGRKNIFLRTNKSLKHPNKDIEKIIFSEHEQSVIELFINFMGLHGVSSQLPSFMLDKLSRNEDDDQGWTLFFDFFNHYLLWIFFDVISLKNYPRSFNENFKDSISKILFSMLGIKEYDIAKKYLPFAPLLLSLRRPKTHIERVLQVNFKLKDKLSIIENLPHQILISNSQKNNLGIKNNILGNNFILGDKFISYQNKIAIYIKDISYQEAVKFMPNGTKHDDLKNSIMFLTNNEFCVDLYLKINYSSEMKFVLGEENTAKLGWAKILGNTQKKYPKGSSMSLNSYMSLNISNSTSNPLPFKITKALIKESLEELFSIECEGFFESLEQDLFSLNTLTNASSHPSTPTTFNFHPNVLIDQEAILSIHNPYENNTLNFDNNEVKNYKGIITYIKYLGINHESALNINDSTSNTKQIQYKHFFSFKLQSVLIRLSLNKANRIYTHTNIIEVIKQTLGFYQDILHKEIDYSNIHFNYEEQELISQYNESDLDFITRLSHNNGIFFYEDENTIYFCDVYKNVKNKEIEYNPNINNILNQACISSIYKEQSLRTNSFTHSSINANTPLNLLSLHSSKVPYEQELNNKACYNEHFYESEYSFTKSIDLKTKPSLKEKRALVLNESLLAKSNIYHLSLGDFITLNYKEFNHQEEIKNQDEEKQDKASLLKDFIIIANTQILIDDAILANSINTNDHLNLKDLNLNKSYSNTLTLLKKNIIFTPSFKAKPKAPNSTQGIVIGESKDIESERNTIYTDEHGRVKVRINLYANQEELDNNTFITNDIDTNSSNLSSNTYKSYHHTPFLRVASHIASNHSGFFHTPRIGDEVIISFLDDDIDKPYVSGSLYNGA
ncbi:type VI secretion system baseplate subunit TssG, partial [Campylobacter jejuni]|nr:type VI secretion system baseplate subunit TssG [Campylobacter jejuni]